MAEKTNKLPDTSSRCQGHAHASADELNGLVYAVEACGITCHRRFTSRRRRLTSTMKISWQRRRNRTAMNRPFSAVVNIPLNHPSGIQMILPNSLITVRMKKPC